MNHKFNDVNVCLDPEIIINTNSYKLETFCHDNKWHIGMNANLHNQGFGYAASPDRASFKNKDDAIKAGFDELKSYTIKSEQDPKYLQELESAYADLKQLSLF